MVTENGRGHLAQQLAQSNHHDLIHFRTTDKTRGGLANELTKGIVGYLKSKEKKLTETEAQKILKALSKAVSVALDEAAKKKVLP